MTRLASAVRGAAAAAAIAGQLAVGPADAFCGLYVAQADAKLFNTASKVVLARDGDQTAITMSSDYQGDATEFALVVPVPSFIQRQQIAIDRVRQRFRRRLPDPRRRRPGRGSRQCRGQLRCRRI